MLHNKYFVCPAGRTTPIALNPFSYRASLYPGFIEIDYLAGALQELEQQGTVRGLTFYITWDTRTLPHYGEDVVVILMGDEWCRFPHYLGKVATIFRSHSNWPMYTGKVKEGLTYGNLITFVQFARLHILGLPARWRYLLSSLKPHLPTSTFIIPLGYANQAELPVKPLDRRTIDLSFMGSMNNVPAKKTSLKYWLSSPKNVARAEMAKNVRLLEKRLPKCRIYLQGSEQFAGNLLQSERQIQDEKVRYSQQLLDSKIVLVPRGSSLETFRLFEAMRYGCIAICENLPRRWYYKNLPALKIDRWDQLEDVVVELLNDPQRLEALHQAALEYWRTACSEAVLGKFMTDQLAKVTQKKQRSSGEVLNV